MSRLDYFDLRNLCASSKAWKQFCDSMSWVQWADVMNWRLSKTQVNYVLENPFISNTEETPREEKNRFMRWLDNTNHNGKTHPISWPKLDPFERENGVIVSLDMESIREFTEYLGEDDEEKERLFREQSEKTLYEQMRVKIAEYRIGFYLEEQVVREWVKAHLSEQIEGWSSEHNHTESLGELLMFVWMETRGFFRYMPNDGKAAYEFLGELLFAEQLSDMNYNTYLNFTEETGLIYDDHRWLQVPSTVQFDPNNPESRIEVIKMYLERRFQYIIAEFTREMFNGEDDHTGVYMIYFLLAAKKYRVNYAVLLAHALRKYQFQTIGNLIKLFLFNKWFSNMGFVREWANENMGLPVDAKSIFQMTLESSRASINIVWKGEVTFLMLMHHTILRITSSHLRYERKTTHSILEDIMIINRYPLLQQTSNGDNVMHFTLGWMIDNHDDIRYLQENFVVEYVYPLGGGLGIELLEFYTDQMHDDMARLMLAENKDGVTPLRMLVEYIQRTVELAISVYKDPSLVNRTVYLHIREAVPKFTELVGLFYKTFKTTDGFEQLILVVDGLKENPNVITMRLLEFE